MMDFASIRVITDDVATMTAFYEKVTGLRARWGNEMFAEIATPRGTLALAHSRTMTLSGAGAAHAADNHSVIIEFRVDDVDARFAALGPDVEIVQEPTTQPWGNRSLLFRDPDGNLVNLFAPVE